jgi:ABC-2 type transport system permease protein
MSAGSRVLRDPLDSLAPFIGDGAVRITDETVAGAAVAIHHTVEGAEKYLFPPVIDLETVQLDEDGEVVGQAVGADGASEEAEDGSADLVFTIFLFVFPGVSVYALFLVGDIGMRDILAEADAGTLRRQVQGPVSARTVILAKTGYSAVLALVALVVLSLTGWIAKDGEVDLLAYGVLSVALVLAVTGAGAAIYGAAGSQGRGATISAVVFLFLAFAGGSFIELGSLPAPVRVIAPVSPFYWGTEGYRTLLQSEGSLGDVAVHAGILAAIGVVLLSVGAVLLGRRLKSGVA